MKKNYFFGIAMISVMMLVSAITYGQIDAVAHYKFDETSGTEAADASGNDYHATVSCDTCWVEGTTDGGLMFHGNSDENVTLPATEIGLTNNIGSVALWVKLAAEDPSSIYTLWSGGDNTDGGGFGPENEMHFMIEKSEPDIWSGGEFGFWTWAAQDKKIHIFSDPEKGPSAGVKPVNPVLVNDGEWHHLAITWGKGVVKLYGDGVAIWDTTFFAPKGFDLTNMFLGSMLNGSRALKGILDDVRIYDDVLDDAQVEDLYNKVEPVAIKRVLADEIGLSVFPNPAVSLATLEFNVEAAKNISVNLYSVTGGLIANIHQGISTAGKNLVHINTDLFQSGIYFIELQINSDVAFSKLVIQ